MEMVYSKTGSTLLWYENKRKTEVCLQQKCERKTGLGSTDDACTSARRNRNRCVAVKNYERKKRLRLETDTAGPDPTKIKTSEREKTHDNGTE